MKYTPHRPKLTDTTVMEEAREALNETLPLVAEGYVCTGADLWQILLGVSAKKATIHGMCAGVQNAPSDSTVRGYLNAQLRVEELPDIEQRMNAALAAQIPRRVFKKGRDTAIDLHDQAYYGKTKQAAGLWVRAEAKDGTTRVYRVATAYVIWRDMRLTLALRFVLPDDDTVSVLSDLLKRLKGLKYRIRTLYLDRGFDGVRIMRFVTKTRLTAVIACTIRGKTGGTRALCRGRGSYCTRYTFHSPEHGQFTATLAVSKFFTTARRTGRHPRRADWMIFIMIRCAFTPQQVRQAYRRRFGIESSYRCARHTRGWTTSPNPALRFVLIALSFFLVNVWVALRWMFAQIPRRGGRLVDYAHFRLQRLIDWIARVVDRIYQPVTSILALAVPIE
jgi:IS4 transposase